jgi:lysozyme family protein
VDNFPPCVAFTLTAEGGFVNNPRDPGGATNMGITLHTLSVWLRRPCSIAEVRTMPVGTAQAIYRGAYWHDGLPLGVDLMVFDFGVNTGLHESAVILQSALGVEADGDIGPETMKAVAGMEAVKAINALGSLQEAHYKTLSGFPTFGHGWLSRTASRVQRALAMVPAQ